MRTGAAHLEVPMAASGWARADARRVGPCVVHKGLVAGWIPVRHIWVDHGNLKRVVHHVAAKVVSAVWLHKHGGCGWFRAAVWAMALGNSGGSRGGGAACEHVAAAAVNDPILTLLGQVSRAVLGSVNLTLLLPVGEGKERIGLFVEVRRALASRLCNHLHLITAFIEDQEEQQEEQKQQ